MGLQGFLLHDDQGYMGTQLCSVHENLSRGTLTICTRFCMYFTFQYFFFLKKRNIVKTPYHPGIESQYFSLA